MSTQKGRVWYRTEGALELRMEQMRSVQMATEETRVVSRGPKKGGKHRDTKWASWSNKKKKLTRQKGGLKDWKKGRVKQNS